jgi:cytochrome c oxidase assembly protein subunit 15
MSIHTPGSDLYHSNRAVRAWLVTICVIITVMVSIGGITRLTGSGLSITDWAPIMGAIPPLSEADWQGAFEKYRQIPQYRLQNSHLSLGDFKFLYFWEWFHRLVGRLIGIVSIIPGIWFFIRGRISKRLALRVLFGVFLGGLQGALGWFMVKSGLIERTSVSHYRLAAHLVLALIILAYFVWLARSVFVGEKPAAQDESSTSAFVRPFYPFVVFLFSLQIVYGAFVAGMKAGFAFNTFPLMAGAVVPSNLLELTPTWLNLFENPATLQWIHRTLGWIVFFSTNGLWIALIWRRTPRDVTYRQVAALAQMTIAQFGLGVATLVWVVPLPLAVLHQFGAAVLVILLARMGHALRVGAARVK